MLSAKTFYKILPDINKIAVVRVNGLGDYLFIIPALYALRAAYPEAEIVLLGKEWHVEFLTGRPGPVNRVIVVPPVSGVGTPPGSVEDMEQTEQFFRQMRREKFDLAIQMHGGGRYSNPFTARLGARTTLGLRTPDALPLDLWMPYIMYQSEVLRYLELVSLVGAPVVTVEPTITVMPSDIEESYRVVAEKEHPLVAIHPGATDPRRHWPTQRFAVVGDALAAAGASVIVIGTEDEGYLTRSVIAHMKYPAQDLSGQLSINGLTGLLSRCTLLIANDSDLRHLAEAVGTATVSIYWCGNMITAGPVTRTRHRPLIAWQIHCPICGIDIQHSQCEHRTSFVATVPTEDVLEQALDLFTMCGE